MKILLINGPPGCGKDTAARAIIHDHRVQQLWFRVFERFSMPLKSAVHAMLGRQVDAFGIGPLEPIKEQPLDYFSGLSYRQMQIALSEKLMKPELGDGIFGKLLVSRIRNLPITHKRKHLGDALVLVPDSGFVPEAMEVVKAFGASQVVLVRLHADGCTFDGDSRGYIELPNVQTIDLYNNKTEGVAKLTHDLRRAMPFIWEGPR
jgi:DNA polymerase III delta prime subunit